MRNLLVFLLSCISISSIGQVDSVFKTDGKLLLVNVTEINESSIRYLYPNESLLNSISKGEVIKIHFRSGRIQEFSSTLNISRITSCLDWENVQISNIESEVIGLQKIDVVSAKAKGMTTMSSSAKLQDRAYDKIKIATAMLGGNVSYIIEQHTEGAMWGGEYGSSRTPSVTISGQAYTTRKVSRDEISFGEYRISEIFVLRPNEYSVEVYQFQPQNIRIEDVSLFEENRFQKVYLSISSIKDLTNYSIIFTDEYGMVLSGVSSTKKGKTTYYNVILIKN